MTENGFREEEESLIVFHCLQSLHVSLRRRFSHFELQTLDLTYRTVGKAQSYLVTRTIYQAAKQRMDFFFFFGMCPIEKNRKSTYDLLNLIAISKAAQSLSLCPSL